MPIKIWQVRQFIIIIIVPTFNKLDNFSWTYDGWKVDLHGRVGEVDLSRFVLNGEWDVLSAYQVRHVVKYTCCEEPYIDLTFYINMRRKTLYYLFNVFFPTFIMSSLTLLTFLLPPDSGEKCAVRFQHTYKLVKFLAFFSYIFSAWNYSFAFVLRVYAFSY